MEGKWKGRPQTRDTNISAEHLVKLCGGMTLQEEDLLETRVLLEY